MSQKPKVKTLFILDDCVPYEQNHHFVETDLTEFQVRLVLSRWGRKDWVVVCSAPRDAVTWNGGTPAPIRFEDLGGRNSDIKHIINKVLVDTEKLPA